MKKITLISLIATAAVIAAFATREMMFIPAPVMAQSTTVTVPTPIEPSVSHQQVAWIYSLEYCESQGIETAVNPKDSDGTPSYYSFQWKPGTFKGFALKYKVLTPQQLSTTEQVMSEMKNYNTQVTLLKFMVNDPTVNFKQQFPNCVRTKVGLPPKA